MRTTSTVHLGISLLSALTLLSLDPVSTCSQPRQPWLHPQPALGGRKKAQNNVTYKHFKNSDKSLRGCSTSRISQQYPPLWVSLSCYVWRNFIGRTYKSISNNMFDSLLTRAVQFDWRKAKFFCNVCVLDFQCFINLKCMGRVQWSVTLHTHVHMMCTHTTKAFATGVLQSSETNWHSEKAVKDADSALAWEKPFNNTCFILLLPSNKSTVGNLL